MRTRPGTTPARFAETGGGQNREEDKALDLDARGISAQAVDVRLRRDDGLTGVIIGECAIDSVRASTDVARRIRREVEADSSEEAGSHEHCDQNRPWTTVEPPHAVRTLTRLIVKPAQPAGDGLDHDQAGHDKYHQYDHDGFDHCHQPLSGNHQ